MKLLFVFVNLVGCLFVIAEGGQATSRDTLITQMTKQLDLSPDTTRAILTGAISLIRDALRQGRDFSITDLISRVAKKAGLPDSTIRQALMVCLEALHADSVGLATVGGVVARQRGVSERKGGAVAGKVVEGGLAALQETDRDVVSREILLGVAKGVNMKEQVVREVLIALLEAASPVQEQPSPSQGARSSLQGLTPLQYTFVEPLWYRRLPPEKRLSPGDVFTIEGVWGTSPKPTVGARYVVRGTYTLTSLERAYVQLTYSGNNEPTKIAKLSRGTGTFEVEDKIVPGAQSGDDYLDLVLMKELTNERYLFITLIRLSGAFK